MEFYSYISCFSYLEINFKPAEIRRTGEDHILQWEQPENFVSTANAELKYKVSLDFCHMRCFTPFISLFVRYK